MTRTAPAPARPVRRPSRGRLAVVALGIVAALLAVRIVTGGADVDLPDLLSDLITFTLSVIIESLPFVLLGVLLSLVVQVWVKDAWISRVLPSAPVPRRIVLSLLGVVFPVCECGNVPFARGLMLRGVPVSDSFAFLLAAPIINPVTIITTHQAFGFDDGILVVRLVGGFLIANLVAWLYSRHPEPERLLTDRFAAECRMPHSESGGRAGRALGIFQHETASMLPALFLGALVAGAIQVAVPRDVLLALGTHPVLSVLAMMALAIVISVCSSVDAFFVLPFASSFLPGGIVAFLLLGPIVDVKMLALLRTTFTPRTLAQISGVVALACLAIGLGVNLVS